MTSIILKPVIGLPISGINYVRGRLNDQWESCGAGSRKTFFEAIRRARGYISVALLDGKYDDLDSYLGVRRAIALDIGGDPRNIPENYPMLTDGGAWSTHNPSLPRLRRDMVLVDFMQFYPKAGVTDIFIPDAKTRYNGCRSLDTFSPPTAVRIHKDRGAKPVHVLPEGRPGYSIPAVVVNSYWAAVNLEEVPEERVAELLNQLKTA